MPPRMITMVIPVAKNRFDAFCLKILNTFLGVRNVVLVVGKITKKIHIASSAMMIPILSLKYLTTPFFILAAII